MKPILFNTDMVRAILDGRKTATRRVVKPQPKYAIMTAAGLITSENPIIIEDGVVVTKYGDVTTWDKMPYRPGDILYVRETWCRFDCSCCEGDTITGECLAANGPDENEGCWMYRASNEICGDARWRPSIHMPREAARIFLRVTDVRVKRLQWCGNMEAKEEGCTCCSQFVRLWDSTIKPADRPLYGWEANPWVWVIKFERVSREEAIR